MGLYILPTASTLPYQFYHFLQPRRPHQRTSQQHHTQPKRPDKTKDPHTIIRITPNISRSSDHYSTPHQAPSHPLCYPITTPRLTPTPDRIMQTDHIAHHTIPHVS